MSLIIDADGEYLQGTGGAFSASSFTDFTFGLWIKRVSGSSGNQAYASLAPDLSANTDSIHLAHNSTIADCRAYPGNTEYRVANSLSGNSTAWQLLVWTYDNGVENRIYDAITGGSVASEIGTLPSNTFGAVLSQIRIGASGAPFGSGVWPARARLAHVFAYDICLSGAQVTELFSGGTGGGKNPTAVAPSNLKFYAELNTDATVTTGGVSLSATGSLSYDGADNPTVDAAGGSATSAVARRAFPFSIFQH